MKTPFGYRSEGGSIVPDPVEAPVRRRIYELFQETQRLKTVARLLTEEGFRTRSGAAFTDTSVRRLIKDRTAKGEHPQLGAVEAIVPGDVWDACNTVLEGRQEVEKVVRRPVQLFAGLAVCACGRRMTVRGQPGVYSCSPCTTRVSAADLETVFVSQLPSLYPLPDEASEAGVVPVQDRWSQLDPRKKRQVLEAVTHRIVVGRDEVFLEVYDLLGTESSPEGATDRPLPSCGGLER